ncbi:MAG: hypothetical protein KAJ51_03315, partial [Thermoplasmata archaeon]|nr:hypothetical protein [Thermoplasmata archaeon]
IFTYDVSPVVFSNAWPSVNDVSTIEDVEVGITISDSISGVDASSVEYAITVDKGKTWEPWLPVPGLNSGMRIDVALNLTFQNSTGNRIKWRALDIAGNGPTESIPYIINVNTWEKEELIPKVRLWGPPNGSIVSTTAIKLIWKLINKELLNVTYDIYFDTVYPPTQINRSDINSTSLLIEGLTNGETYYWTVLPRLGILNGSCISGVWSFEVDIAIPSVILIAPENSTKDQSVIPTFEWSVNYTGSRVLTFDIYLSTDEDPKLEIKDHSNTYYSPESALENNKTYYWKIVPNASGVIGHESVLWSFTVGGQKNESTLHFELKLFLDPDKIELAPGESKTVKAIVLNLGELNDKVVLKILEPKNPGITAEINGPNILDAIPNGTVEFNIIITASEDVKKGEILLTVVSASSNAAKYYRTVEAKDTLIINIVDNDDQGKDVSFATSEYWLFL